MLNEALNVVRKDIKADVTRQEIKELRAVSGFFYKKYFQNLNTIYQQARVFHLILLWIPSSLVLPIENCFFGGGGRSLGVFYFK